MQFLRRLKQKDKEKLKEEIFNSKSSFPVIANASVIVSSF